MSFWFILFLVMLLVTPSDSSLVSNTERRRLENTRSYPLPQSNHNLRTQRSQKAFDVPQQPLPVIEYGNNHLATYAKVTSLSEIKKRFVSKYGYQFLSPEESHLLDLHYPALIAVVNYVHDYAPRYERGTEIYDIKKKLVNIERIETRGITVDLLVLRWTVWMRKVYEHFVRLGGGTDMKLNPTVFYDPMSMHIAMAISKEQRNGGERLVEAEMYDWEVLQNFILEMEGGAWKDAVERKTWLIKSIELGRTILR